MVFEFCVVVAVAVLLLQLFLVFKLVKRLLRGDNNV